MQGPFGKPRLIHVHGVLFFAWPIYIFAQSWLAATGRTVAHREWGLAGVALATAMCFSVVAVTVERLNQSPPAGIASSDFFAWVHVFGVLFFGGAVGLALANTRRPQVHRKLMLFATLSLLNAAVARWSDVIFGPFPSKPISPLELTVRFQWSLLVVLALMIAPAIHDRRTDGRWSRVWLIGIPLYTIVTLTAFPVGGSALWRSASHALKALGG